MGMYDTYEDMQCKAGYCTNETYRIGDDVPMKEGIFMGCSGFIIVDNHKLIAVVSIKGKNVININRST